jgi:GlpG protein
MRRTDRGQADAVVGLKVRRLGCHPAAATIDRSKEGPLRQIGTLPRTSDPQVLGDYLLSLGVTSRAVESPDGWDIWVHNEDLIPKAKEALAAFERDSDDPRFTDASRAAEAERLKAERLDRQYRKNVRDLSGTFGRVPLRRRPLTAFLVAVCVTLFVVEGVSPVTRNRLRDRLGFFSIAEQMRPDAKAHGLDAIHRGEVWRLITPIFIHLSPMHLLFNMWALLVEGTVIETRQGTRKLLALVILSAVVSNVGQYLYVLNFSDGLAGWFGISGVVYAFFGYLWMKGVNEPEQGMILHPSTVRIMLLWLLLGFTPVFPMANGAHIGGLIVGVLYGLARF